jgi:hypothetical protein
MKFLKIFSFLLSLMLLSCSSSSSDGDGEVTISCSPTRIDVPAKGGTYKIMIVASWSLGKHWKNAFTAK